MFQFGLSLETQFGDSAITFSVGWGLKFFANQPWWRHMLAIVAQGAPGIRRFGLIVLGFFVTAQFVDMDGARKSILGAQISRNSSVQGKNTRAGAVNR